jgi:adenylosuccinate synthase
MPSLTVVGAQWGDEGKGKIVDLVASVADLVVRFGGGNNAGHTLVVDGRRVVLHLIPSGILYPDVCCILGDGMVVDLDALIAEIDVLGGELAPRRLLISRRAHLVLPYHRALDEAHERTASALGTTRRGIGPAYEDKAARRGARVGDLLHPARLRARLAGALDEANARLARRGVEAVALEPLLQRLDGQRERLAPHIADTSLAIHRALAAGRAVLFEGAQGALLDIDHGTYPFVTSSTTIAGGAAIGGGLGPGQVGDVIGVAKAYVTRVGEGPFPTELHGAEGEALRTAGREFGATTGRPRRCGWLDLPALRYAARLSGLSSIALTKLDVLSGRGPLRVCVAYHRRGAAIDEFPSEAEDLGDLEPIYVDVPGFEGELARASCFEQLPGGARAYIELIEREVGIPVCMISVGPEREETLWRDRPLMFGDRVPAHHATTEKFLQSS